MADRIEKLIREGGLVICRGQLIRIGVDGSTDAARAAITWRPAGETLHYRMTAEHVVNCMGPGRDPVRSKTPLIPGSQKF